MFNTTFNNIAVISWRSVLLVEETTDLPQVTDKRAQIECSLLKGQHKKYIDLQTMVQKYIDLQTMVHLMLILWSRGDCMMKNYINTISNRFSVVFNDPYNFELK